MRETIRPKRFRDLTKKQIAAKKARDVEYENAVKNIYKDLPPAGDPGRAAAVEQCKILKDAEWEKYKTDALAGRWWEEVPKSQLVAEIDVEIAACDDMKVSLQNEKAAIEVTIGDLK